MNAPFGCINKSVSVLLLLTLGMLTGCALGSSTYEVKSPRGTTTTFILVRHAEKESNDVASPLNAKGRERAQALVDAIVPLGVTAIYCTRTKRNLQTVEPAAEKLGIAPNALYKGGPMNAGHLADQFVRESLRQHGGGVILWVGNTSSLGNWADNLHQVYLRLGGVGQGPRRYDDFFIITLSDDGRVDIQRRRYGDPAE